jgi:small subunit ribosomal protein S10
MAKYSKENAKVVHTFVHDAGATPQIELFSADVFGSLFRGANAAPAIDNGVWEDVFNEAFSARPNTKKAKLHVVRAQVTPAAMVPPQEVIKAKSEKNNRGAKYVIPGVTGITSGVETDNSVDVEELMGRLGKAYARGSKNVRTNNKAAERGEPNIRIRLKAFDYRVLDADTAQIVDTAKRTGAHVRGPIPLPNKIEKFTVLRGPHVDKKSRDQFEVKTHYRLLEIVNPTTQTFEALSKIGFSSTLSAQVKS